MVVLSFVPYDGYMNDNETNQVPQARQLKIKGLDGKMTDKKEPKEKEKPGNKWIIVGILFALIIAALFFKLTSGVSEPEPTYQRTNVSGNEEQVVEPKKSGSLFGPAEYNFSK